MHKDVATSLAQAANGAGTGLAPAALLVARIEYPRLDVEAYLAKLDAMGEFARQAVQRRLERTADHSRLACIKAVNEYLFDELQFVGNREKYEDPRNSCLNEVLDRRTGIPITLCVVYMEVARRAGLHIDGVNFPGHFLVRCRRSAAAAAPGSSSTRFTAAPCSRSTTAGCCCNGRWAARSRSASRCWRRRPGCRSSCAC